MKYPSFFDEVDKIKLYEPLGKFLGAFETGEVEISYLNCVFSWTLLPDGCQEHTLQILMGLKENYLKDETGRVRGRD